MGSPAPSDVPVALVTGAAHRLGKALALGLARAGFRVALHHRSALTAARETLEELDAVSPGHSGFQADLASTEEVRRLVSEVALHHGHLDLLVHSASPWLEGPVESVRPEDWDQVFAVGPRAGFFLAQAAAPFLKARHGALLFISDVAATQAWPFHVPHAVAKAAINALVENLAAALGPEIRVNGIAPGVVIPPAGMSDEAIGKLTGRTPLRRLVAVEDVVSMAIAVARNRSMTGQIVAVDAGRGVV